MVAGGKPLRPPLDKIDGANLVRDTQVYLLTCWRLCTLPVLPFNYTETANELRDDGPGKQRCRFPTHQMVREQNRIWHAFATARREIARGV